MIIYPAIDIKEGKVVRLIQGRFDKVTEYSNEPCFIAARWKDAGAQWLHVVDLDGAKTGRPVNVDVIKNIVKEVCLPVQTGGGIRTAKDIDVLLNAGVSRVILGTKAVDDIKFLQGLIETYKEKIVVSLDCSGGFLTKNGWVQTSNIKATDFVGNLEQAGLELLVYTDIATDGMLSGPNLKALNEILNATKIPVIASGGVSDIEDIRNLKKMESQGLAGIITGKAIYEGTLDLKEAIEIAAQPSF